MSEAIEIKRPSAALPTPAPSQAFLTTPSPRCYEKVVRKRGPGLGGRRNQSIQYQSSTVNCFFEEEATRHESRGESPKKVSDKKADSTFFESSSYERELMPGLSPLAPRLEATSESLRSSPVAGAPTMSSLAIKTPARRLHRAFDKTILDVPKGRLAPLMGARDWRHPCRPKTPAIETLIQQRRPLERKS